MLIQKGSVICSLAAFITSHNPVIHDIIHPIFYLEVINDINLGIVIIIILSIASSINHVIKHINSYDSN